MIAQLNGTVVYKEDSQIIVDVGGVGYEVLLTATDAANCVVSQDIHLYTHFHVRESSQELFGFTDPSAKILFTKLISVSGLGPKMAMNVLSLGPTSDIKAAIADGNGAYIAQATGVGKRLAERITVDLKDKVGFFAGMTSSSGTSAGTNDAKDALVALGYTVSQAEHALTKVDNKLPIEEQVKKALKALMK